MHPYRTLPQRAFWKPSVATKNFFDIDNLWNSKFEITKSCKIISFGSCFAQHIGRILRNNGFNWLIEEPAPEFLDRSLARGYSYDIFSARTGNIYTTSLLKQWIQWALEEIQIPDEVWINDKSNVYDPFRPRVEPNGFESVEEMMQSRDYTISRFSRCLKNADIFIFTLGLTESWFNIDGYEYPMCPGTAAGTFNERKHIFKNQNFQDIYDNLRASINLVQKINPHIRFIFTVSPVPLTATNSGKHVLEATIHSKSILRAVAGELSNSYEYIDYFPSYEIVNCPASRGLFFEPNLRSITNMGVEFIMEKFFEGLGGGVDLGGQAQHQHEMSCKQLECLDDDEDDACDEAILEAFSELR